MNRCSLAFALAVLLLSAQTFAADDGAVVRVTPLGSHAGEFCRLDRALLFEDPDGTRILYDAGRTVAGADDPRLGDIDVVLVSHVHGDHIGDQHIKSVNAGTCAGPETPVAATPHSSSVLVAVEKGAKIVTGTEMPRFFATKLKAAGGNPDNSVLARFGGSVSIGGVTITTVPAVHSNGLDPAYIANPLGDYMRAAGIAGYVGEPTGYVLTFSNGLVAYLSGDTGITADQDSVVRGHYKARLAVMNIGDTFTTGPSEAAYVINELIRPAAVIASHANEEATRYGKVLPGTRTETFIKATHAPVHLPLSGKTLSFDRSGQCREGC